MNGGRNWQALVRDDSRGLSSHVGAGPVLQRFREMGDGNLIGLAEIGDGARQFEHAMIPSRRKLELAHGGLHHLFARRIERNVGVELLRPHVGIGDERGARVPRPLADASGGHPSPDRLRRFPRTPVGKLLVLDPRHLDVNVDSIEQGTADAFLVALDYVRRASTFAQRIAEIAAWARVHRRDKYKHVTIDPLFPLN